MPKTRKLYSKEEDRKIIKYIEIHKTSDVFLKGNVFWKELQNSDVLPNRTWHSLRDRYLKYLKSKRPNHVRRNVKHSDVSIQEISSEGEDESHTFSKSANYRDTRTVGVERIDNRKASSPQRVNDQSPKALTAFDRYVLRQSEQHRTDNLNREADSPKVTSERKHGILDGSNRAETTKQVAEIRLHDLKRKVKSPKSPLSKEAPSNGENEISDASKGAETTKQVEAELHCLKTNTESPKNLKSMEAQPPQRESEILDASVEAERSKQVELRDETEVGANVDHLECEETNEHNDSERTEISEELAGQNTILHMKSQGNCNQRDLAILRMITWMRSKVTATLDEMFFALHQTNANLDAALAYLQGKESINFWAPEEDLVLRGCDEEAIKTIIVKHGHLAVQQRLKFLKGH